MLLTDRQTERQTNKCYQKHNLLGRDNYYTIANNTLFKPVHEARHSLLIFFAESLWRSLGLIYEVLVCWLVRWWKTRHLCTVHLYFLGGIYRMKTPHPQVLSYQWRLAFKVKQTTFHFWSFSHSTGLEIRINRMLWFDVKGKKVRLKKFIVFPKQHSYFNRLGNGLSLSLTFVFFNTWFLKKNKTYIWSSKIL